MEDAAGGECGRRVAVVHMLAIEIPFASRDELGADARVVGIGDALFLGVLEFDIVAPRAERRHEPVFKPETLGGEHEARDVFDSLRIRAGAGRVCARVGAAVIGERGDRQGGVRAVVGREGSLGDVVASRELVLRILGRSGVDDWDVAIVDEDLVAPAAEAILRGGLAKHSDAMPAKPARGVPEGCGGAEAINLVGCAERIFKPHGLEVEPADVRIGDRAGGAVRAR